MELMRQYPPPPARLFRVRISRCTSSDGGAGRSCRRPSVRAFGLRTKSLSGGRGRASSRRANGRDGWPKGQPNQSNCSAAGVRGRRRKARQIAGPWGVQRAAAIRLAVGSGKKVSVFKITGVKALRTICDFGEASDDDPRGRRQGLSRTTANHTDASICRRAAAQAPTDVFNPRVIRARGIAKTARPAGIVMEKPARRPAPSFGTTEAAAKHQNQTPTGLHLADDSRRRADPRFFETLHPNKSYRPDARLRAKWRFHGGGYGLADGKSAKNWSFVPGAIKVEQAAGTEPIADSRESHKPGAR